MSNTDVAQQIVARQAEHRLECAIDKNELACFRVLDDDRDRDVLDDRIEKLLGLVQLHFGAPLLGDVLVRRDPAASRHWLIYDGNNVSVTRLHYLSCTLTFGERCQKITDIVFWVAVKGSVLRAAFD